MKYVFKFASLLKIRRYEVDREQQKLGKLLNETVQLEKKMDHLNKELHEFDQPGEESKSFKAAEIRKGYEFKKDLQEKIWRVEQELERMNGKIETQRKKLFDAKKRSRIFEKLEKRERAKFIERVLDKEQKQQNEIAIQMYNRNL